MNKKSKGFTLIELLAVLTILAVIALITYPIVTKTVNVSSNSTYDRQVEQIERAAANWFVESNYNLSDPQQGLKRIIVDLDYLLQEKYLEKDVEEGITNSKTGEKITGCVHITYVSNQYKYEFFDSTDKCYCDEIDGCQKPVSQTTEETNTES